MGFANRIVSLRRAPGELRQVTAGLKSIVRYALSQEPPQISLSLFTADSAVVRAGEMSTYRITIANNTRHHCLCSVLIDIYLRNHPTHSNDHYAYFGKAVFVRAQSSQELVIGYDWNRTATAAIDGVSLAPDSMWRGSCTMRGTYLIRAARLDHEGQHVEDLVLAQELR